MARYGTDIRRAAQHLSKTQPESRDPSQDVLVHLALAFAAVKRLEEMGADLEFQGRPLVLPSLERAYREMLHLRPRLPADWLSTSVFTRFGRLVDESKVQGVPD